MCVLSEGEAEVCADGLGVGMRIVEPPTTTSLAP